MDIKISLEIGLSPTLEGFLTKMLGGETHPTRAVAAPAAAASTSTASVAPASDATPETTRGEDPASTAEDPQPEAQRRTRRTKAQMAEDAAATNSGSTGKTDDGAADAEATATEIAETGGGLVEALERISDIDDVIATREGVTAKADVAAKMQEAMAAASPKKVQEKMIEHLNGAKNLSGLDPALYGKAVELFDSIIAGA